ncbi:MAG: membrane dipeptidase [Clostridiaceae bacterium]
MNNIFLLHTHYLPKALLKTANVVGAIIVPDFYSDMNLLYWNRPNNYSDLISYIEDEIIQLPTTTVWNYSIENINMINGIELSQVKKLGVISIQLFHNKDNVYYSYNNGLTISGISLLNELSINKFILDLSHVNEVHLLEICKFYNGKICISHCGCSELYFRKQKRTNSISKAVLTSLSDFQNVYFGIAFLNDISCEIESEQNDEVITENIANQLILFKNIIQSERIMLGPDYFNIEYFSKKFNAKLKIPHNLYDNSGFESLKQSLRNKKMSEIEIDNIFYKNGTSFILDSRGIK